MFGGVFVPDSGKPHGVGVKTVKHKITMVVKKCS